MTAAHCVAKPFTNELSNLQGLLLYLGGIGEFFLTQNDFVLVSGTSNLKQFSAGIQVHQALQATLHPEYNHTYYFNDIAVLKLSRNAEFNDFVRPVCLWEDSLSIDSLIGKSGRLPGSKKLVLTKFLLQGLLLVGDMMKTTS